MMCLLLDIVQENEKVIMDSDVFMDLLNKSVLYDSDTVLWYSVAHNWFIDFWWW